MIRSLLFHLAKRLDYRSRALAAETALLDLTAEHLLTLAALRSEREARIDADLQACRADARRRVLS